MNPSTQTIFLQAIDLDPDDRAKFLDHACKSDPRLRAAVEALLWADANPDILTRSPVPSTRLSNAAAIAAAETLDVSHGLEGPGSVIGPYRLIDTLGEGGFGRVFIAEQEQPVRRQVALKILKAGMDTRQIIGRFEAERQALALMDHPGIAKVFDAGTTSTGRPYFVMELVKGKPLTDFADEQKLTLRQRLELYRDVCLAVQHAHTKGVIHRDLKPTNILVSMGDDGPIPKVIDFGIAKATGARLSEKTVHTQAAQWLGTPEYMSPEQAGGGQDIDTRSDVYSLGAALYELLVGVTPFDTLRMRSVSYDMVARMIREDDPPRPSTRLSRMGDDAGAMADRRRTDASRLAGALKGDLDWIVMRAIEKDPARRYDTAAALAADIQRFLDDKPVEARPPTTSYQVAKWVRRNRGPFIAACAVGVAIILGIIGLGWGLVRAADEARRAERSAEAARVSASEATDAKARAEQEAAAARAAEGEARAAEEAARIAQREALESADREGEAARRAEQALAAADAQRERAEAVESFIQNDMLDIQGSDEPLRPDFTVRQMVENAEQRLNDGAARARPEFETGIRNLLGQLFIRTGDYYRAERNLRMSLELMAMREQGARPADYADVLDALGVALNYLDRIDEAREAHEGALEIRRQLLDEEPNNPQYLDDLAVSYSNLGGIFAKQEDWDEAERYFLLALEARGPTPDRGNLLINLGAVLAKSGRVEDGIDMLEQGIDQEATYRGHRSAQVGVGLAILGEILFEEGRPEEAVEPLRAAVSIRTEIFGPEHKFTMSSRGLLGRALLNSDPEAGLIELAAASDHAQRTMPIEDTYRLSAQQRQAMGLYQLGRYEQAEPAMVALEPVMRHHFPPGSRPLGGYLAAYADVLLRLAGPERAARAEPLLRECLQLRQAAYPPRDRNFWLIEETRELLGAALLERAKAADDQQQAVALLREAESLLLTADEDMSPPSQADERRARCLRRIVDLYQTWDARDPGQGIAEKAAPFQERLGQLPQPDPS